MSSSLFRPIAGVAARTRLFTSFRRRPLHTFPQQKHNNRLFWCTAAISATALITIMPTIHLDAVEHPPRAQDNVETVLDPATSIEFPKTICVPSKIKIPTMTLLGLGVRTVSFLGIKVYSVGFYADLENPNLTISQNMSSEEKIEHIVKTSACIVRIVPVRTTSYTHLRDAFMRALQARMALRKKEGTLSEDDAYNIGTPMRKLKSLFPNSPLQKHTPLDILLMEPSPGRSRALVFRDLGAIEDDWVAAEFVLHYFEGVGPSPALKKSVIEYLESLNKPEK